MGVIADGSDPSNALETRRVRQWELYHAFPLHHVEVVYAGRLHVDQRLSRPWSVLILHRFGRQHIWAAVFLLMITRRIVQTLRMSLCRSRDLLQRGVEAGAALRPCPRD